MHDVTGVNIFNRKLMELHAPQRTGVTGPSSTTVCFVDSHSDQHFYKCVATENTSSSRGGKKTLGRTVHDNVVAINYLLDNIWVFFVGNSDCWHSSVVQKENLVLH